MNYRDKNGKCTADNLAKRCKCDHAIVGSIVFGGGECYAAVIGGGERKCTSKPAKKESEK